MPDDFNPYHVWLSIRPEEQPPNHYRLLGLQLFETNADVIDSAADRQMAHLRTFQSGKHGDLTQRLLNEVAAARVCLLDPKKRAVYDQQLRAKMPAAVAIPPAIQPAPASVLLQRAVPMPSAENWDEVLGTSAGRPAQKAAGKSPIPPVKPAAQPAAKSRHVPIGIALGAVLLIGIGFGVYSSLTGKTEGTLVFDWPDRTDVTVTVDGTAIEIPVAGAWELSFPAGPHRVVAQRSAYKLSADVNLAAGQRVNVPPDWQAKATLILAWPLTDRAGAVLKIDGRPQKISQVDPLELPVEPGQHRIDVARPGLAPFNQSATISPDQRETIGITRPPKHAHFVLDWPVEQRGSAALTVDGRAIDATSAEPLELTLKPGSHLVRIVRPGFEVFARYVELSEGTNDPLKPTWKPLQKSPTSKPPAIADASVPTTPIEAMKPQPVKKQPIPAVAEQEKIAKQLNELYRIPPAGLKDPAKAQEMYDVAAKDGSSPAERYMLLMKGAEIAASAGDLSLSLQGIDTLDANYEIDVLEVKQKLLDKFIVAGKPDQVAIAIPTAEQLVDQAVAADRFDIATVLATSASKAVAKSKIAAHKEVEERLAHRRRDIHLLAPLLAAAKKAQETLEKSPADADANLTVGRWLSFYKGDWTAGLPLLARGSDEKLKSVADEEIKAPAEADQQVRLADAWWDLAQKEAGVARDSLHLHAGNIYRDAMPNLASVLKKAAIEKRLAEIADLKPLPTAAPILASTSSDKTQPTVGERFPLNQWVDLLPLVDPARNTVDGKWTRAGTAISVEPRWGSRIAIPVAIDGSYDLAIKFASNKTEVTIPVGSHGVSLMLGGGDGTVCGFDTLDGRRPFEAGNPTFAHSPEIASGQECALLVRVRLRSADQASIDVSLNGKPLLPHWQGNPAALAVFSAWTMPTLDHPGLGAWDARATFSSVRLRMMSGHASVDSVAAGQATAQNQPASAATTAAGNWVDLLRLADTARDAVSGKWSREGNGIVAGRYGAARLMIPISVDGSYDLEAAFSRVNGSGEIRIRIPVGSHACDVEWSTEGKASGLDVVSGRRAKDDGNPTKVVSAEIENDRVYHLGVKVRLLSPVRASVDVLLDGKPFLRHWEGNPSALSVVDAWTMPKLDHLGLGVWDSQAKFDTVRLRMISGHATLDDSAAKPAAAQTAPTGGAAGSADKWVDLLRLADTTRDVVKGNWSRAGQDLKCESADLPRIALPFAVNGGYDLEVEFTRTSGKSDIAVMLPVGSHSCVAALSAYNGTVSGLANVDGHDLRSADNPTALRPARLENGQRYTVLVSVRSPSDRFANIDVSLDGKPYLPHWEGNPTSLGPNGFWLMPNSKWFGLGAQKSDVTFHSARLRLVSGNAAPITPPKPSPASGAKSAPLRFTKWEYKADERGVPGYFQKTPTGWIEVKEGKVWAHFVEAARTADHVELFDQGRGLSVRMTPTEAFWSRDKVKWNSLAKGMAVEETDAKESPSSPAADDTKPSAQPPAKNANVDRGKQSLRLAEKTQLERDRKEILAKSGDESHEVRRAALLIEAARIAIRLGDEPNGVAKLANVISTTGHADDGNQG